MGCNHSVPAEKYEVADDQDVVKPSEKETVEADWKRTADRLQGILPGRENKETATDRVYQWLGKAPPAGSACFKAVQRHFPGAMPSKVVHNRTKMVLEKEFGFTPDSTLLGSSFCPDEVNNHGDDLPTLMRNHYGSVFPMGGLGGVPNVGETGYAAFSSHVPENGDIIVVFGPHTGVSLDGEVGKHLREGQSSCSGSCGAVTGAYKALVSGSGQVEWDSSDIQMSEIKQEFAPHIEGLSKAESPEAACTYQAWELVKDRMLKIVNTKFGSGRLILIGGITLNLPDGNPELHDHFLPLMFEVRQEGKESIDLMDRFSDAAIHHDSQGEGPWAAVGPQQEVFAWMSWSPPSNTALQKALHQSFPGALPAEAVTHRAVWVLEKYGFTSSNTLLGTSFCPDEVNNEPDCLGPLLQDRFGKCFPMGGLGGIPFTGKTGFAAFSSHVVKDGGHILVAFGPHTGISEEGEVGKVLRKGQTCASGACGAVTGAYKACCSGWTDSGEQGDGYDLQMDYIKRWVCPKAPAISKSENPMADLTHQSYSMVQDSMFGSVNTGFGSGYLCLLGGITLNLGPSYPDHFYPMTFELRRAGEETVDLIHELREIKRENSGKPGSGSSPVVGKSQDESSALPVPDAGLGS